MRYPDPLGQFILMTQKVGGQVVELSPEEDINDLIVRLFPEAKEIASNLPEIRNATRNPDTVEDAKALNGTDLGVIRGRFGVAGRSAEEYAGNGACEDLEKQYANGRNSQSEKSRRSDRVVHSLSVSGSVIVRDYRKHSLTQTDIDGVGYPFDFHNDPHARENEVVVS